MPDTAAPVAEPPAPPHLARVHGVEVFAAGLHHGEEYGEAELDRAVENFHKLKGSLTPTVVLGHEEDEDQELLKNSGIPAAGVVADLRKAGGKLVADFADVPPAVAKLINSRAYRKVSAEFYPDYEDQGQRYGLTLRRVALLGGEIPEVKTLADIPLATFAERRQRTVVCFTEAGRPQPFVAFGNYDYRYGKSAPQGDGWEKTKTGWRRKKGGGGGQTQAKAATPAKPAPKAKSPAKPAPAAAPAGPHPVADLYHRAAASTHQEIDAAVNGWRASKPSWQQIEAVWKDMGFKTARPGGPKASRERAINAVHQAIRGRLGAHQRASVIDVLGTGDDGSGTPYFAETAEFDEKDWRQQRGPHGGTFWVNAKTGAKKYQRTNPGGKGNEGPAKAKAPDHKAAAKQAHADAARHAKAYVAARQSYKAAMDAAAGAKTGEERAAHQQKAAEAKKGMASARRRAIAAKTHAVTMEQRHQAASVTHKVTQAVAGKVAQAAAGTLAKLPAQTQKTVVDTVTNYVDSTLQAAGLNSIGFDMDVGDLAGFVGLPPVKTGLKLSASSLNSAVKTAVGLALSGPAMARYVAGVAGEKAKDLARSAAAKAARVSDARFMAEGDDHAAALDAATQILAALSEATGGLVPPPDPEKLQQMLRLPPADPVDSTADTPDAGQPVTSHTSSQKVSKHMDRDTLLSALADAGFDTATITPETPDSVLASILKWGTGGDDDETPEAPESPEEPANPQQQFADDDEDGADPVKCGEDAEPEESDASAGAPEGMPPGTVEKKDEPKLMSAGAPMPKKTTTTHHYSEKGRKVLTFAEAQKIARAEAEKAVKAAGQKIVAGERIKAFSEKMVKEGRWFPAEQEAKEQLMYTLAEQRGVVKFSENGKASKLSPLEAFMASEKCRPAVVKFGELIPQDLNDKGMDQARKEALLRMTPAGAQALAK